MIFRLISILVILLLIFSCNNYYNLKEESIKIEFPNDGATFSPRDEIVLKANNSGKWYSDKDGNIGEGELITVKLSTGKHLIHLEHSEGISNTISIKVIEDNKECYVFNLVGNKTKINLPRGNYKSGYISFKNKTCDFLMSESTNNSIVANSLNLKTPLERKYINQSNSRNIETDSKIFRIYDLSNTNNQKVKEVIATKFSENISYKIWIDDSSNYSNEEVTKLDRIIPSLLEDHKIIWGEEEDINSDGKLGILLSDKINKSGTILGYFNPGDFFEYNTDINSKAFNPYSNEMDILYVAIPESDSNKYTLNTILATISHELTHLKNFSKIYNQNADKEKVFLEEGLAHLAESLAGYGESGGNYAFLERYLQKSKETSLNDIETQPLVDTLEKRGGMALLLSWLFWKEGGITYVNGEIVDRGGIKWLHKLRKSKSRGWDKIEDSLNSTCKEILLDLLKDLLQKDKWNNIYHIKTNENMILNPYAKNVVFNNKTLNLNGLVENTNNLKNIYPYSIGVLFNDKDIQNELIFNESSKDISSISLIFMKNKSNY